MSHYSIDTPCGKLLGLAADTGYTFKGIRYATAGRWEYPHPVTHWEGEYQALEFGPACWQPEAVAGEEELSNSFYFREFRSSIARTFSEDCLFLNVWTPKYAKNAPVLFYIHGGAFFGGCGHEKQFRGEAWTERGVVLVTLNYRLGAFGFCCLPELAREAGYAGNYGLYDQLAALEWVRRNIAAFGGDPENITLMGQSAGAVSAAALCVSPQAKGLFRRAILMSGGGVDSPLDETVPTLEAVYPLWEEFKARLGGSLDAMRAVPAEKLCREMVRFRTEKRLISVPLAADGSFLPRTLSDAVRIGAQYDIPYILGVTSQDLQAERQMRGIQEWAVLQAKQEKAPVYCYCFSRALPGDDEGAWHSSDLWYAFGSLAHGWRPFTKTDYALSEKMMSYFHNFVRCGDPNGDGLPIWEPSARRDGLVMRFDETVGMDTWKG